MLGFQEVTNEGLTFGKNLHAQTSVPILIVALVCLPKLQLPILKSSFIFSTD
ncbi:conserved hypothetical protein [Treponema phagedenis]|uniref:Uncharacterized protein n=1 Tax=Treponema phagedenis TaxID=162 RepID=A0A0B7GT06_TREPH|nr:hypothetical protein HMPREF9554_01980 [Treponema phagedenis F0421]CEM60652.1 conserved hypothetical protein [Treponema phagedenis]